MSDKFTAQYYNYTVQHGEDFDGCVVVTISTRPTVPVSSTRRQTRATDKADVKLELNIRP